MPLQSVANISTSLLAPFLWQRHSRGQARYTASFGTGAKHPSLRREGVCGRCGCTCGRRTWRPSCSTVSGGDKVVACHWHLATNAVLASQCLLDDWITSPPAPSPLRLPRHHHHRSSSASGNRQPLCSPPSILTLGACRSHWVRHCRSVTVKILDHHIVISLTSSNFRDICPGIKLGHSWKLLVHALLWPFVVIHSGIGAFGNLGILP